MTLAITRRAVLHGASAALATSAVPGRVSAQAYPSKPIRIVHGYNSGTNPDVISRVIAPALTERLGQPIVVEPKPGSAGRIATGYVATQEPDGYTMMMLTAGDGVTAAFDARLPYNLLRDYAFIATVVHTSLMIVVSADSALNSVRDLVEAGKSKPGGLTFGTPGVGTTRSISRASCSGSRPGSISSTCPTARTPSPICSADGSTC